LSKVKPMVEVKQQKRTGYFLPRMVANCRMQHRARPLPPRRRIPDKSTLTRFIGFPTEMPQQLRSLYRAIPSSSNLSPAERNASSRLNRRFRMRGRLSYSFFRDASWQLMPGTSSFFSLTASVFPASLSRCPACVGLRQCPFSTLTWLRRRATRAAGSRRPRASACTTPASPPM